MMKRKLYDLVNGAGKLPIGRLAVGSLWAPVLWFAVIALEDGRIDPAIGWHYREQLMYQVVSLLTAAAFLNLSLWLVHRKFPGVALTLWIPSVGISGLLLLVVGLAFVCEGSSGDILSFCSDPDDMTPFTLFVSGVMASFTLPGWVALGLSHLITLARRDRSRTTDAPEPSRPD